MQTAVATTSGSVRTGPNSAFFGSSLRNSVVAAPKTDAKTGIRCEAAAEPPKKKVDRWKHLDPRYDTSDDQQDIARGKGLVDPLFQGGFGMGTQEPVLNSLEYLTTAQRV
jgi:hypothetical protein